MTKRYAPTIRQLVHAALVCIASHPKIQNPGIYHPTLRDEQGRPVEVKIQRWLESGGLVLNNPAPGLACAVYPAHTGRDIRRGGPATSRERMLASAVYETYTLGSKQAGGLESALYRLIVELSFQEPAYTGATTKLKYHTSHPTLQEVSHAYKVLFSDNPEFNPVMASPTQYGAQPLQHATPDLFTTQELEIEINPGEEIIRDYVELMRLVINDIGVLRPFMTKPGEVTMIDLPTGNPLKTGTNIFFHMGYLVWEICCHPPSGWQDTYFGIPTPSEIVVHTAPKRISETA
jgi:hypothetical protein